MTATLARPTTRAYLRTLLAEREGIPAAEEIRSRLNAGQQGGGLTSDEAQEAIKSLQAIDPTVPRPLPFPEPQSPVQRPSRPVEIKRRLPDGYFTAVLAGGDHRTFRIRTQPEDAVFQPGHQIISLLSGPDNTSDYQAVADITPDGRLRVWKKWREAEKLQEALAVLFGDPRAAASAFGLASGRCAICNRLLTEPESIARGIGPVCLEKF